MRALCIAALVLALGCEEADFSHEGEDAVATGPRMMADDATARPDAAPEPEGDATVPTEDASDQPAHEQDARVQEPDAARAAPSLAGTWVSAGDDVAHLLSGPPVNIVRVDSAFGADGTYTVVSTNDQQQAYRFEGTYTVDTRTEPATIVLRQTQPMAARSEGIWRVANHVLTLEVAQVDPPLNGVTAPTVEGGFGSTSNGAYGHDNVQTFRPAR
jgi:hypothetical protein